MTRKEAIDILYGIRADNLNLDDSYTKDKYDALTIAINSLEVDEQYQLEYEEMQPYLSIPEHTKEEQLKKLKAELDYAKFCCALPTIFNENNK